MRIEELLPWGPAEKQFGRGGFRIIRTAYPDQPFWAFYRRNKESLAAAGVKVGKNQRGNWEVRWTGALTSFNGEADESRATDSTIHVPLPSGLSLRSFQKAGVEFATKRNGTLIADEMGLGKTIEALAFVNLHPEIRRVLVVCPAILKVNWQREAERWLVNPFDIKLLYGMKPERIAFDFRLTTVVVCNYTILPKWVDELRSFGPEIVIADEVSACKNPKAQCSKALFSIPTKRRLALTGTPLMNRPKELFPIISWLDPSTWPVKEYFSFAQKFCGAKKRQIGWDKALNAPKYAWDFSGASNLPELQKALRSTVMIRRLKSQVLTELPPKEHQVIELPPDGMEKMISGELAKWEEYMVARKQLANAKASKTAPDARALSQLQDQVRTLFVELSAIRRITALAKTPAVIEHLDGCLENEGKVLCFAHHREVVEKIAAHFGGKAVRIYGGDSDTARQQAVDRFQNDPGCSLCVASIKAAGFGLTLTASSHVVFGELDWVPASMQQAIDRTHRIGQTASSVLIQYLVLSNSVDARIASVMLSKEAIIAATLDSDVSILDEPA